MATPPPKKRFDASEMPEAPAWLDKLLGPLNGFMRPVAEALEHGLTFRENFAGEVRAITFTVPDDWVPLTATDMRNSWQLYPSNASPLSAYTLAVRKDMSGDVEVRGLAIPPSVSTTGIAFAWPTGYAPHQEEIFTTRGELQTVEVRPKAAGADVTARTIPSGAVPAQGWVSFSGMRFTAADRTPPRWAEAIDVRLGTEQRPFPGKPGSVRVESVRQTNAPEAPTLVTAIDWTPLPPERGQKSAGVRIHRVWGLLPGATYSLTLHISPE